MDQHYIIGEVFITQSIEDADTRRFIDEVTNDTPFYRVIDKDTGEWLEDFDTYEEAKEYINAKKGL